MQRHRQIAAAPARPAHEAWAIITQLISDSLAPGAGIRDEDVRAALRTLDPIGPLLVAGGYLEEPGLVVVAGGLHLTITTMSGNAALELDENLNVVPGAAAASTFFIYVPAPEPHNTRIVALVRSSAHLWADAPPAAAPAAVVEPGESPVDAEALRRLLGADR